MTYQGCYCTVTSDPFEKPCCSILPCPLSHLFHQHSSMLWQGLWRSTHAVSLLQSQLEGFTCPAGDRLRGLPSVRTVHFHINIALQTTEANSHCLKCLMFQWLSRLGWNVCHTLAGCCSRSFKEDTYTVNKACQIIPEYSLLKQPEG